MKYLLIRADDVGYSYAVDLGIERSVREGLVKSVGVMPNMPEALRGWSRISDCDIAVGQHTNVCLGAPCAEPGLIPSLLQENGEFKSSSEYRANYKEGIDFVDFDEAVIEIEAQLKRFIEIVGREPEYFEAHAVLSENLNAAIEHVARKHGYRYQVPSFDPSVLVPCGSSFVRMVMCSQGLDCDSAAVIRNTVKEMKDGETVVLVCHPGYLDHYILTHSSLKEDRAKELDALIDSELRLWLESQDDLKLIDYREL